MTYNGWTNYETWAVGMFLDGNYDGEHVYHDVLEATEREAPDAYALSVVLRDYVEAAVIPDEYAGLAGDLLGAALSEVNWTELAESRLAEVTS